MAAWNQIKVNCSVGELSTVTAICSMVTESLMIEDYSDIEENLMTVYGELIDEKILGADRSLAAVSLFLEEEKSLAGAVEFLRDRLTAAGLSCSIETVGVDERDWANEWKKYYHPIHIGEHLVVTPPWESYEAKPGEILVVMDPGMAFGTGTHETTRLCMALMEKYPPAGKRLLDVGTGSGILSIAASKMGAAECFAYDIDPVAVRVAEENVAANGCGNITCGVSDLLKGVDKKAPYGYVCANIVADILIRMAPDLAACLAPGAVVITSGIIEGRERDVLSAMEAGGFTRIDTLHEADWSAMVFQKST